MGSSAALVPPPLGRVTLRSLALSGKGVSGGRAAALQVGIDLVEIAKFRRVFQNRPALLASVFTEEELRYSRAKRPVHPHLAARFAAKEAALKALGTGLTSKLSWRDIEVTKEFSGAPRLVLRGAAEEIARSQGVVASSLSLSHSASYAIAVVLFLGNGAPQ